MFRLVLPVLAVAACGPTTNTPLGPDATVRIDAPTLELEPDAKVPAAVLRATPVAQDFGSVLVAESAVGSIQVTNTGGLPSGRLMATVTGTDAKQFSVDNGGCAGLSVPPAQTCSVKLHFTPESPGTKRAILVVAAVSGAPMATVELTGVSILPGALTIGAQMSELGNVTIGMTKSVTMTVRNAGGMSTGAVMLAVGGANQSEFKLGSPDTCTGRVLAAGASCSAELQFTPTRAGAKAVSITALAAPGGATAGNLSATAQGQIALTVGGSGRGTVVSSPAGLSCAGCGTAMFTFAETPVTLFATAETDSTFGGFTGCDETPAPGSCVVVLDSATHSIGATFVGQPDAPLPDATVPDAPTGVPDSGGLVVRPIEGPKAQFRLIDGQLLGAGNFAKVCIFGDDFDPRPYAVLTDESRPISQSMRSVAALYADVPAGRPLRAAVYTTELDSPGPDGCILSDSIPLRGGEALATDGDYTALLSHVSPDVTCERDLGAGCEYLPRRVTSPQMESCAASHLNVYRDDAYQGAYRVVNITRNAASIASAVAGIWTERKNVDLGELADEAAAFSTASSSRLRICPSYILGCYGDDFPPDALDDFQACVDGDFHWQLGSFDVPRIKTVKRTTIYVIGDARPPNALGTALDDITYPDDVRIVVANDVED